jgi:hypothetical protein
MRVALLVAAMAGVLGSTTQRVGTGGATVALPTGWHAVGSAWLGSAKDTDPVTRLVVASGPVRGVDTGCQVASYAFPGTGVALVVVEWRHDYPGVRYRPRPARFTSRNMPLQMAPALECFAGAGASAQFDDHGRHLGAYVLLGPGAPRSFATRARAVLDTLLVRARG